MKKLLALLLAVLFITSLAACGKNKAENTVVTAENAETEEVAEETESLPEFVEVHAGEKIATDFVEITLGEIGQGEKLKSGYTALTLPDDKKGSNQYFWLEATITNLHTEKIGLSNVKAQITFDGKYKYDAECYSFSDFYINPMEDGHVYIYADIPNRVLESYSDVSFAFAFNENFDWNDPNANKYDEKIYGYDYRYIYNVSAEKE